MYLGQGPGGSGRIRSWIRLQGAHIPILPGPPGVHEQARLHFHGGWVCEKSTRGGAAQAQEDARAVETFYFPLFLQFLINNLERAAEMKKAGKGVLVSSLHREELPAAGRAFDPAEIPPFPAGPEARNSWVADLTYDSLFAVAGSDQVQGAFFPGKWVIEDPFLPQLAVVRNSE